MRPVAPVIARGRPDKVRKRLEPKDQFWRLDVDAVNIEVVRSVNLGSVQFGTSHEQMN